MVNIRKSLVSAAVAVVMIWQSTAYSEMPKAYGNENEIWTILTELTPTEEIAAGIMGFFFRESRLKADAVAGWDARPEGTCEDFIKAVDDGMTKEECIRQVQDFGGYGLGQWHSRDYLESLYDYVKEQGVSIADVRGQCEFAVLSMQENETLWNELLDCETAIQCGRRIGMLYDGTTAEGAEAIAGFAEYYYKEMRL